MGRKYKPLTSHSIIPDASVSKTYIQQGKERKMKTGKMDVWEREEGLSFLQCLNDKIEGEIWEKEHPLLLVLVLGGGFSVSAVWSQAGGMWFKITGKVDELWYGKLENCHWLILGFKREKNTILQQGWNPGICLYLLQCWGGRTILNPLAVLPTLVGTKGIAVR